MPDATAASTPRRRRDPNGSYAKVYARLWADENFHSLSAINPSGQALYLYLLTCPQKTRIPGVVLAGCGALADALDWSYEDVEKHLKELVEHEMIERERFTIWLPNALSKYETPANGNVVKGWKADWEIIHPGPLKDRIQKAIETLVPRLSADHKRGVAFLLNGTISDTAQETVPATVASSKVGTVPDTVPGTCSRSRSSSRSSSKSRSNQEDARAREGVVLALGGKILDFWNEGVGEVDLENSGEKEPPYQCDHSQIPDARPRPWTKHRSLPAKSKPCLARILAWHDGDVDAAEAEICKVILLLWRSTWARVIKADDEWRDPVSLATALRTESRGEGSEPMDRWIEKVERAEAGSSAPVHPPSEGPREMTPGVPQGEIDVGF